MRDQANGQGHHRWAQQHRGGEHAYLKGADSEAGQIDRYQNANESVAKRPNSTGSEHEADIAPLTAGVTHRPARKQWTYLKKLHGIRRGLKRDLPEIVLRSGWF